MRIRDLLFLLAFTVAALLAIPVPALAAGGDCPLVPTLDNFDAASPPQVVDYGEESFRVVTGNAAADVVKDGKICRQDYDLRSGVQTMTGLPFTNPLPARKSFVQPPASRTRMMPASTSQALICISI